MGHLRAARVLVAEPHPELRGLFERVLDELGHEAVVPRDDRHEHLPDVDVLLFGPQLDGGAQLARSLRAAKPDLPVICACSGPVSAEIEQLAPLTFLVKPFRLADLEAALTGAVAAAIAHDRSRQDTAPTLL